MRDYFGLLEHIRVALMALPIASTVVVGSGCGRVDPLGLDSPARLNAPEFQLACVPEREVAAVGAGGPFTGSCPDQISVHGGEPWLPEGIDEPHVGRLDEEKTDKLSGLEPAQCCYTWERIIVVEGRPLMDDGRARLASVRSGRWRAEASSSSAPIELHEVARSLAAFLARAWLRDALAEHASIASFARTTLELIAVGAPRELVRDTQAASLDEVRHADACFELAAAYAGAPLAPDRLDSPGPRAPELARLAIDTFFEGCAGETIAALRATRAEAACTVEPVRAILKMIVRDETRHAALAWRTVAWAAAEGGAPVKAALREAANVRLRARPTRSLPPALSDALAAHGRLDPIAKHRAEEDAWHQIIRPTIESLTRA